MIAGTLLAAAIGGYWVSEHRHELAAATAHARPVEGRLAGFPHGQRLRSRGSGGHDAFVLKLRAVASRIAADTADKDDEESRHAHGVALLTLGKTADSLAVLERTGSGNPGDAAMLNDLAVALIETAIQTGDLRQAVRAIAACDQAAAIISTSAATRFNRALALETLGLARLAVEAYDDCLEIETDSGWREEARRRRADLMQGLGRWPAHESELRDAALRGDTPSVERLTKMFPQQARTFSETFYLCRWGAATLAGKPAEARDELAVAGALGTALRSTSGEGLLGDAVTAIGAAHEQRRISTLARAHATYETARKAYGQRDVAAALPLFIECERDFAAEGSPFALLARYYRANATFDAGHVDEALTTLHDLLEHLPPSHKALQAQILWQLGTISASQGNLFGGLHNYQLAAAGFERLHESENLMSVGSAVARTLMLLGRNTDAWKMRADVFRSARIVDDPARLQVMLSSAGRDAEREKDAVVARTLYGLGLLVNRPGEKVNARIHVDLLLSIGRLAAASGNQETAQVAVARGWLAAAALRDPSMRQTALQSAALTEARMAAATDPAKAVRILSSVIGGAGLQRPMGMEDVYLERARAFRKLGNASSAVDDLTTAISHIERRATTIPLQDRDSYFASINGVYHEIADILQQRGDGGAAFEFADRGRARLLPDVASTTVSIAKVQAALPADALLVHYTLWPDSIGIATISKRSFAFARVPMKSEAIDAAVHEMRDPTNDARATSIGEALMVSVSSQLDGVRTLIVVPDGRLGEIPFGALRSRGSDAFLVERVAISVVPSAAFFVSSRSQFHNVRRQSVIAVGDPAFDPARFPDLPRLPAAEAEATEIAALYRRGQILTGPNATIARFLNGIADCDVVHVGAHTNLNAFDPMLSSLLLAPGEGGDGVMTLATIARSRLSRLEVAVLAGCRTAVSEQRGPQPNLAFGFLTAGTSSVVATLWNVEDSATRAFSTRLHRELARGAETATAVQAAQLEMIRSSDPTLRRPQTWSAFQAYGGPSRP